MENLHIHHDVLREIHAMARAADGFECMGLIAGAAGPGPVSFATLLRSRASSASAEAEPLEVKHAAEDLISRKLVPKGIWHSHARFEVFHSSVDDTTVERLLPAMAAWNFERPAPPVLAPVVLGPDAVALPTPDGKLLRFTLEGPSIPEMDARQITAWETIHTEFEPLDHASSSATIDGTHLRLAGAGVVLSVRIPEQARVVCEQSEIALVRLAQLFSLVVNEDGDSYAECLTVRDFAGHSCIERHRCEVETIAPPRRKNQRSRSANGAYG